MKEGVLISIKYIKVETLKPNQNLIYFLPFIWVNWLGSSDNTKTNLLVNENVICFNISDQSSSTVFTT